MQTQRGCQTGCDWVRRQPWKHCVFDTDCTSACSSCIPDFLPPLRSAEVYLHYKVTNRLHRRTMYLKKQDVLDKKSASIFYFMRFYHRSITRECALCTCRQEQTHIHSNPMQSNINADRKWLRKQRWSMGQHVQNPAFCCLLTSQWSEKKCAKTPFPIPLELVPHNWNKHLLGH